MGRDEGDELRESFGYWVSRVGRAMTARFAERLAAHGVTGPEWSLLSRAARGAKTPVAIADDLGIDRAAVSRMVDSLERKGLVARTKHPTDRRSTVLALTERGRDVLPKLVAASRDVNRAFLGLLTPEEAAALEALMRKLGERLPGSSIVTDIGRE